MITTLTHLTNKATTKPTAGGNKSMIMTHHKLLVVLLLLLQAQLIVTVNSHTAAVPSAPCLAGQAAALLRLKRSFATTNASVRTFASWRAGTDCCRWDGVRCGHGSGRVTSLDLAGRGLQSAALDPAIFSLTSLRYLDLAYNEFNTSKLPSTGFDLLTQLTHLNLSNSNFSDIIPANIGGLTNLVSIDLSVAVHFRDFADYGYEMGTNATFRLQVPNLESLVANLKNLRELRLGSAYISDNGTEWCSALAKYTPNLRVLSLPFCFSTYPPTPICGSFSGLRSLAILDLQFNGLSGPIPDFFANFSSLRVLQLSDNDLQGWLPSIILQQTKLVTLDLSRNPGISGSLPRFSAASSLENLLVGGTNFSGKIPSSIGNLKSLKKLDLGATSFSFFSNQATGFSGTIPSSIGMLRSLELLALSGFELVGSITSWIGNLTSLTILQLSNCGLSGSVPSSVGDLKNLRELTLSNCKFYGNIPSSISNLTQLDILDLQSNDFFGTVQLSSFLRLPNLFILSLSNNKLVVVDGEHNSSLVYPGITILGLASCGIEKFPKMLGHLGQTNWLDLSQNRIRGAIPQWASETWSDYIQYLNLSHNKFTSFVGFENFPPFSVDYFDLSFNMFEGPITLPQGQVASVLDYSSNKFSSMPLKITSQLEETLFFKASRNHLSGSILPFFCGLNIEILDLSYNNLTGPIPSCLMEDTSTLKVLNLKQNRLHGELPHNVDESCLFEALDIGDNEIEGQLPRSLAACKNLEVLDIQTNQISDSFPCWMSTLGRLHVLVLKSNKFFGQVGPSTAEDKNSCEFPNIRVLDLASNNFSGMLTEEWFTKLVSMMINVDNETWVLDYDGGGVKGQVYQVTTELTYEGSDLDITVEKVLRILGFLDVSNNTLQGNIPAGIGKLVLLNMLNMSYNSLTGLIPPQFGHLTQLEALDLSSNELSGEIPHELASLDFLGTLNLSNNKLVGSIPESPQFMTFSNSSFLGNNGLCGPPLSKECINRTTQSVVSHHSKNNSVDIMLFLFSGIGFGVGFAIAIVVAWGIPIRKRS